MEARSPNKLAAKFTALEPSEADVEDTVKDIIQSLTAKEGSSGPQDLSTLCEKSGAIEALIAGKPGFDDRGRKGSDAGSQPGTPKSIGAASSTGGKEESLSDVDDEELEAYLLDVEEQQHKSDIWHEVNKDYLEEWHTRGKETRRKKRQAESSQQDNNSETGSRATSGASSSKRSRRLLYPPASSCTQSAIMALSAKGKVPSNRINVEAIQSLFDD